MAHRNPFDQELKQILIDATTIAMVGASSNPEKASFGILQKLQKAGYRVIPVNPRETEILGERSYPSLVDVPERIDIVDVFRRPEHVAAIVDDCIRLQVPTLWLQLGVVDDREAHRAQRAGIRVIMDRCIYVDRAALE